jgi:hypothetical protein
VLKQAEKKNYNEPLFLVLGTLDTLDDTKEPGDETRALGHVLPECLHLMSLQD